MIRYFVVIIVFGILMITRIGNPLAAFVGVMGLKVSAYVQPMLSKKSQNKNAAEAYASDEMSDGKTE